MTTYVLHPGYVQSRHDRQTHYVGISQLRHLYQIPRAARVLVADERSTFADLTDAVHCHPRDNGDYPALVLDVPDLPSSVPVCGGLGE